MPNVLTEDRFSGAGHYIVSEANGYRSREQGVVASGSGKIRAGTVMGRLTATKKLKPYTPGASDGSEKAIAILYEGCDATSADVRRTYTARDSEVQAGVLQWAAGVTDSQKTAALVDLAALGIVGR
ncbi:head decoration protein [Aureimonas sp. AU40]|uniref:head decoration protein n=1 Tax=Aureimonas sp. AU40 TaxID=1637747 RepID=UPI000785FCEA|nr:head decoration protein [Aureimonas sp. AU40]